MLCERKPGCIRDCAGATDSPGSNECGCKAGIIDFQFTGSPKPTRVCVCPFVSGLVRARSGGLRCARRGPSGGDGEASCTFSERCAGCFSCTCRCEHPAVEGEQGAGEEVKTHVIRVDATTSKFSLEFLYVFKTTFQYKELLFLV